MPSPYYILHSATGNGSGDSWANAFTSFGAATAADIAGDVFYVSVNHAESAGGAVSIGIASAGTNISPTRFIATNQDSPVTENTTISASATTTNNYGFSLQGTNHFENIAFNVGSGSTGSGFAISTTVNNGFSSFKNCAIRINSTGATNSISCGGATQGITSTFEFTDCIFKFGATGQRFVLNGTALRLYGGKIEAPAAGNKITNLFTTATCVDADVRNLDFSELSASFTPISNSVVGQGIAKFVGCTFPATWAGALFSSANPPIHPKFRAEMWNCKLSGSSTITYPYRLDMRAGQILTEVGTTYKNGGATEGTSNVSWKFTTNTLTEPLLTFVESNVITIPSDTTGAKTVNVDFTCDNVLTTSQIWIAVDGYGSSKAGILNTAGSAIASSSAAWTSEKANKGTLQLPITVIQAGNIYVRVCVGKPSETVYVDYAAYLT